MKNTKKVWMFMCTLFASVVPVFADLAPVKGDFVDYFFVDRWKQGVFGSFYVDPELHRTLHQETWGPVRIEATDIRQPMNPGGAMIHHIRKAQALSPDRLQLELKTDHSSIPYGKETTLTVKFTNDRDKPVSLYRRDLHFAVTVHKRGTSPEGKVPRDEIFDCFNNPLHDFTAKIQLLRATTYVKLFTDTGYIRMQNGNPELIIQAEGGEKRAGLYDEQKRTVEPGESVEFQYTIGKGWWINEYEFSVRYYPRGERRTYPIMSKPLSFDVLAPENIHPPKKMAGRE